MRWSTGVVVVLVACGDGGGGTPDARRITDGAQADGVPADGPVIDAPPADAPPPDAAPPDAAPPDAAPTLYPPICPGVPNNTEPDVLLATMGVLTGTFTGTQDNGGNDDPDVVYTLELPDVDEVDAFATAIDATGDDKPMSVTLRRCGGGIGCTHDLNSPSWSQAQRGREGAYSAFVEGDDTFGIDTYTLYITGTITANGRCDLPLAQTGALVCAAGTTCDGTRCTAASGPCANGLDDDGDGLFGFPHDPGCASLADPSEADDCATTQLDCPACATTADEDGDGDTGYPDDVGCDFIGDATEIHWCETDPDFPDFCPMCADGFDNDADGNRDFYGPGKDCGCDWAAEDSEYPES
jgi:hypothetical protein